MIRLIIAVFLLTFSAKAATANLVYDTNVRQVFPTNIWFVGISTPTTPTASSNIVNKAYVDAQIATVNTNGFIASNAGSGTNNTFVTPTITGPAGVNTAPGTAALFVYDDDPSDEAEIFRAYAEISLTGDIDRWWGSYNAAHVDANGHNVLDRVVQVNSSTLFRGAGGINYSMQFHGRPEIDTPASLSLTNTFILYGNIVNSSTAGGKYINPYHGYFIYSGAGTNENPGYLLFSDITTPFTGHARTLDMRMSAGTGKFNIYQSGSASNYIAGPIGQYAAITMVGSQLLGDTGSAAAPSYAFYNGNEDTGIYRPGNKAVGISTAGTARWQVNSSGHTLWATDNTLDIGANGATRPRTIYAGTDLIAGNDVSVGTAGSLLFASEGRLFGSTDGVFQLRLAANTTSASLTQRLPLSNKTADYAVLTTEGNTIFNNGGATAQVVLTLPSSPTSGLHYRFNCLDADGLVVAATNSHTIRMRGVVGASNGYISSTSVNATVLVVWDGSAWDVVQSEGPWTVDGSAAGVLGVFTPTTTLAYSGTNVTLTASLPIAYSRTLTLTNNCLLSISTTDGAQGNIYIKPDASTPYTVYLDSGIRMQGVAASGSFVVTNSATETVVIAWQSALRGASAVTVATKGYFP